MNEEGSVLGEWSPISYKYLPLAVNMGHHRRKDKGQLRTVI